MTSIGKVEKAYLDFGEPSWSGKKGSTKRIPFVFNPKDFTVGKAVEFAQKPTKTRKVGEYLGTKPQTVTLEMFLDDSLTKAGESVQDQVKSLLDAMEPTKDSEKKSPSPPFCSFGWGTTTHVANAIVKTVSVTYLLFDRDGKPLRALVKITLEEQRVPDERTNPTSGSPDTQIERIVHPGDSLASIAFQELGSPGLWRAIAEVNGVDDPLRLTPGTSLLIPSPDSLGPGSQN